MKKLLSIVFLLISFTYGFSQSDKPIRLEVEASIGNPSIEVIPAGKRGTMVLVTTSRKADKGKFLFQLGMYNPNLQKMWVKDISLSSDAEYLTGIYSDSCMALLFIDNSKNDQITFYITVINVLKGDYQIYSGRLSDKSVFAGFEQIGKKYYLASNGMKEQCNLFEINSLSGEIKEIIFLKNKIGTIECLKSDEKNKRLLVITSEEAGKKEMFTLHSVSLFSNKAFNVAITPSEENKEFTNLLIKPVDSARIIIAGTYVHHNERVNTSKREEQDNTGFFTALFKDSTQQAMHYYNFIDYKNFYNYLSQEELIKIKKKAEKKGIKENEFSLNYKLLLHDIFTSDNNNMLVAEVFTPEYRTVTRTTIDFYGRPIPETYTVFDGYRLLNTLLFSFNDSCNYLWDNNFEVFDVLDFDLFKRVSVMPDSNNLVLAYSSEGKLVYKVIHADKTLEGPEHIKLETGHNADKINEEKKSHLVYWYDSFILAYGYQQIKNHIVPGRSSRSVFYINKIGYK